MSAQPSPTFSGAYGLSLIALVKRWNVSAEQLLAGFSVTERELEDPRYRMPAATLAALSERCRQLTGEAGIGFHFGLHRRLSMYGHLGFAVMSAGTIGEWIELAQRYMATASTALSFELEVRGRAATLHIREHAELGSAHDIAIFSLLVGLRQTIATATGRNPGRILYDIPIPKPAYFERFAHLLPDARFGKPALRIHFDARTLSLPLVTPDRAALRLAREACERQLEELGLGGNAAQRLSDRVRALALSEERIRTVDEVARALHVSTRTLKRRLATEGTTYTDLIERERHVRAQRLLRTSELAIDEIARSLGYASAASFARAFRRWAAMAPAHYRRQARSA